MTTRISIRNRDLPKNPRVFDVIVDENGEILRYEIQNVKGLLFINNDNVKWQIQEALNSNSE